MNIILKDRLSSIKIMGGSLNKITNIKDIPNSLYLKGDFYINKKKGFRSYSLVSNEHFRKSFSEIRLKRNKDLAKIKKDNPNINHMTYKELMKQILFGDVKNER